MFVVFAYINGVLSNQPLVASLITCLNLCLLLFLSLEFNISTKMYSKSHVAIGFALLVLVSTVAASCKYDSDCGPSGKCSEAGVCLVPAECQRHRDCLRKGLYFECENLHCIVSKHKICRSDDDCKKNWINKKCINDRCTNTIFDRK